jgi:CHASE3 domain sensor protein
MKIRQKLTLGFLGTSLLVGVVGYVSILANVHSKYHIGQLSKVTVKVVDNATEMAFALQAIQVEAQRVIIEKQVKSSEIDSLEAAKESKEARESLNNEIERFEALLSNSRQVTESGIQTAKENGYEAEVSAEEDELEAIDELEAKFILHKKLISQYLILSETSPYKAEEFLEITLKQSFKDKLLPLIREYEVDAEQELDLESTEIEEDINAASTVILGSTTVALLIAILFGSLIARSIANSINKLQNAVIKVGKGKL